MEPLSYRYQQGFAIGSFKAMASPCEVHIETTDNTLAENVCATVMSEAQRIERTYSRYRDDNIIHAINTAGGQSVEVDPETALLLDFADFCYQSSEGLFDITSGVLGSIWRFDGSKNIPDDKSVQSLLPKIGWDKVQWKNPILTMPAGMSIDLGGFGKEFAVDRCMTIARSICDDPMLINFGGDIIANKPPQSRQHWIIGIEPIAMEQKTPPAIQLSYGAIATSGDSKRYLTHDGAVLSHVLNPKTGYPVEKAPASVTVMAENCTQAGMMATLAMLKGARAESFLNEQGVTHWIQRRNCNNQAVCASNKDPEHNNPS
jgi:thiamine biosynthesis lipoprotein